MCRAYASAASTAVSKMPRYCFFFPARASKRLLRAGKTPLYPVEHASLRWSSIPCTVFTSFAPPRGAAALPRGDAAAAALGRGAAAAAVAPRAAAAAAAAALRRGVARVRHRRLDRRVVAPEATFLPSSQISAMKRSPFGRTPL